MYRTEEGISSKDLHGWFTFLSWSFEAFDFFVFDTTGAHVAAKAFPISHLSFVWVCVS